MKRPLIIMLLLLSGFCPASGSKFEELDKPPEGAHKGQMFLGGVVGIGIPFGNMISHEKNLVKNEVKSFDTDITKELAITHLSYDYGINFEYMPFDYIGAKTKLKNIMVVQRTLFGSNYQNWNESIFQSFLLTAGPSFHLTNRKMWDITLSPFLGYFIGKYSATPIADILLEDGYSGSMNRDVNGLAYGMDLSFVAYFSGGLYISMGIEWTTYSLSFSPAYNLTLDSKTYMNGKSSGSMQTGNLIFSAGYAFDN